ncbi:hypothetical protein F5X99DRAFT_378212 [Biscogniauxia marginata]|nr:hypothetical protein F5X99DRAFT_378212 [Biscogniauxia marginata]
MLRKVGWTVICGVPLGDTTPLGGHFLDNHLLFDTTLPALPLYDYNIPRHFTKLSSSSTPSSTPAFSVYGLQNYVRYLYWTVVDAKSWVTYIIQCILHPHTNIAWSKTPSDAQLPGHRKSRGTYIVWSGSSPSHLNIEFPSVRPGVALHHHCSHIPSYIRYKLAICAAPSTLSRGLVFHYRFLSPGRSTLVACFVCPGAR